MTLYLDSESGNVYHDDLVIGNAGEGPYVLEDDIISVIVSEQLPSDSAPVDGSDLKTVLTLLRDEKKWGRPDTS